MPTVVHNKLVRDRIPEIIEQSGSTCITRILTQEEYLAALDAKLQEELMNTWWTKAWRSWPTCWRC